MLCWIQALIGTGEISASTRISQQLTAPRTHALFLAATTAILHPFPTAAHRGACESERQAPQIGLRYSPSANRPQNP
ncbi:hypothetical protein CCMA1212_003722 [Trichoderma ghanense]|uniref:Uncharacterized protein n=1 Tax=Trichoderma ghanense TaxID=65468 RepID=A0ABY2HAU4_9HYPO